MGGLWRVVFRRGDSLEVVAFEKDRMKYLSGTKKSVKARCLRQDAEPRKAVFQRQGSAWTNMIKWMRPSLVWRKSTANLSFKRHRTSFRPG